MPYRYKKRRYKLKPFPIIIALLIVILLVWLVGFLIKDLFTANPQTPPVSSGFSSEQISDVQEPSSTGMSAKPSSEPVSEVGGAPSEQESSKPASSKPTSSKATPSSKAESSEPVNSEPPAAIPTERPAGSRTDWNLILLNPQEGFSIEKDLDIEKTKFDTQYVDSRAAQSYKDMRAAAKAAGIDLYLRSGYRSMATQKQNYDNAVANYVKQGKSKEEAIRLTNQYYTVPGHSEHHTGLAFDIITPEYHNTIHALDERFAKTDAYSWLVKNCAKYGFILRYPKGKEATTGINFEPWHYRYVGVEHAQYAMANDLTLEEYWQLFEE